VVAPAAAATKVACVGDSITEGDGPTSPNAYPWALRSMLGAAYDVRNFGDSGRTMMKLPGDDMSYWSTTDFAASQSFAPAIVVIMLGTNDSKPYNWRNGNNAFEADYRAMIALYAGLPSKPAIHIMLPPPALSSNHDISPTVIDGQILPIIRRVAAETQVGLIDVHAAFLPDPTRYFGAGDGLDTGDGIHPNDTGATLIAQTVARALSTPRPDAGADAMGSPVDARAALDTQSTGAPPDARARADGAGVDGPSAADAMSAADTGAASDRAPSSADGASEEAGGSSTGGNGVPARTASGGCQCRQGGGGAPLPFALIIAVGLLGRRPRRVLPTPRA
jgi:acyl-CoA thioesterase-1